MILNTAVAGIIDDEMEDIRRLDINNVRKLLLGIHQKDAARNSITSFGIASLMKAKWNKLTVLNLCIYSRN